MSNGHNRRPVYDDDYYDEEPDRQHRHPRRRNREQPYRTAKSNSTSVVFVIAGAVAGLLVLAVVYFAFFSGKGSSQPHGTPSEPLAGSMSQPSSPTGGLAQPVAASQKPAVKDYLLVDKNGKGDCTSVTEALGKLPKGFHIRVSPGLYNEKLVLTSAVKIVGTGKAEAVTLFSAGSALECRADGIVIENMTIQSSDKPIPGETPDEGAELTEEEKQETLGMPVLRDFLNAHATAREDDAQIASVIVSSKCTFKGCIFSNEAGSGLYVTGKTAQASLNGCKISGCHRYGLTVSQDASCTVEESEVKNCLLHGMVVRNAKATVRGCSFASNTKSNILAQNKANLLVEASKSRSTNYGVLVSYDSIMNAKQLDVSDCSAFGIISWNKCQVTIEEGNITSDTKCALYSSKSKLRLRSTKLSGSEGVGLGIWGGETEVSDSSLDGFDTGFYVNRSGTAIVTGSQIANSREMGLASTAGSTLTIRDCQVTNSGGDCVAANASTLRVFKTKIWKSVRHSVFTISGATLEMEECETSDADICTVAVKESTAVIRKCKMSKGRDGSGLQVESGKAEIIDSEFFHNDLSGIVLYVNGDLTAVNCRFFENKNGLAVFRGSKAILMGCSIERNRERGIRMEEGGTTIAQDCSFTDNIVYSFNVVENSVGHATNCRFSGGKVGIGALDCEEVKLIKCTFANYATQCVLVNSGRKVNIEDCVFTAGTSELAIYSCADENTIRRVEITGALHHGIRIEKGHALLEDCTATKCNFGILVSESESVVVRRLKVSGSTGGGLGLSQCSNAVVEDCEFVDNEYCGMGAMNCEDVEVRRCKGHDSNKFGFLASGSKRVTFSDCEAIRCGMYGFLVDTSTAIKAIRCVASENGEYGFRAEQKGRLTLEKCSGEKNGSDYCSCDADSRIDEK